MTFFHDLLVPKYPPIPKMAANDFFDKSDSALKIIANKNDFWME